MTETTHESDGETQLSAASGLSNVSEAERKVIEDHSRPNAALLHETIRAEGESELERPISALLLSGFAAGLAMGFSLIAESLIRSHLPDAPWRDLVSKFGYAAGFIIVVLGRQQLFTENTLTPILPLLYHRDRRTLLRVARLWGLVLVANIVGTWVVAAVLAHSDLFQDEMHSAFAAIGAHTIEASFGATVLKGIFAGWLIALMVWLMPGAGGARLMLILLLTWLVSLAGFAHIVAGSVDAAYLVLTGAASFADYTGRFFLPTLIGNVVGGVTLVAVLNFGQVASEVDA